MPKTEIHILGQKYTIKGDVPEDEMQSLARYVDGRIKEVLANSPNISPLNAAILASLNIAQELHLLKKEHQEIAGEIARRATMLSSGLFE